MDIAIVTGASSALGLAISRRLIQLGFRVYGLGGDYKDCSLQNVNFKPVPCDLADSAALESACKRILEKEKGIYLLVNNAKYFGQQSFEKMSLAEIERILKINLLCPLVLMRLFANSLRELQGFVIQMGSPFAESSQGGAAGAATAGGLKWMGEQLFNEYRDSGVKVCHLSPEPNRSRDARMQVRPGARTAASIDPEAVAQAIEQILQSPFGNVVTEMVLRPLRINEPEHEPVWKIPYPDPQPIPYTVPREFIDAEEQLEEEEWKTQQQLKRKRRSERKKAVTKDDKKDEADKPKPVEQKKEPKETGQPDEPTDSPAKSRRRSRRKPRPQKTVVGFHEKEAAATETHKQHREDPQKQPEKESREQAPEKKPFRTKKKTARKAASKSDSGDSANTAVKKAAPRAENENSREAPGKTAPENASGKPVKTVTRKVAEKVAKKTVRKHAAKKAASHAGKDKKTS